MIGTLIVVCTGAFAAIFAAVWWLRPGLRRDIEAPKHGFAARVRQYDEACRPPVGRRAPGDGA